VAVSAASRALRRHCPILSILVILLATEASAQLRYPFYPAVSNPGEPSHVLSGDFTGDGIPDLAAASPADGRIRVHARGADGEFRGGASILLGGMPFGLFAADFDQDQDLDLAWIDAETGAVGVILFSAGNPPDYVVLRQPGSDEPTGVVLADVDGDGWKDLLAAHGGADEVVTYPNLQGDLGPGSPEPAGDRPDRLVLLEHEGGPTLALRQSGRLSRNLRLTNLSDGSTWSAEWPSGGEIFAADVDGDGQDELLLADEVAGEMSVRRHDAGAWIEELRFEIDGEISGVDVAEVAPGTRRLAIASVQRRRVALYSISPAAIVRESNWYSGGRSGELLYEDVDGDAAPDIVLAQGPLQRLQIFPPFGEGLFAPEAPTAPIESRALVEGIGDGGQRLYVIPGSAQGQLAVYRVQGTAIGEPVTLDAAPGVRAARFGDLDGNPGVDIASVSRTGGFRVHLGDGTGGYSPLPGFLPEGQIGDLTLVDVVGGPALDLILARLDPPALVVHEGLGDGRFTPTPAAAIGTSEPLVVVRARDLDLDGREDIIALGFDSLLTIFLNRAGEALQGTDLLVENSPRDVAFGRFNADAYPDMVTVNEGNSDFSVLTSLLPGVYTVAVRGTPSLPGATRIEVADFDQDGVDDLAIVATGVRSVGLHLNTGTPEEPLFRFSPPVQYELVDSAIDLSVPDLDGDGQPDLVGLDGDADVLGVRLSDPFGAARNLSAALVIENDVLPRRLLVSSDAEYAHDLRLLRHPGQVIVPLVKIAEGRFEAFDDAPATIDLAYLVIDRLGHELDRVSVGAVVATAAPGDERPRLLPARYDRGRTILRMRAADGVIPEVKIYDLRGRRVAEPDAVGDGSGWFEAVWEGTDFRGRPVSRGRYLVRASLGPVTGTGSVQLR
jgi:hypothetical protein